VNTTYFLAGFGLPDGLVKWVAQAPLLGDHHRVRATIRRAAKYTAAAILVTGAVALMFATHRFSPAIVLLAIGWWCCYGVLFFAAQVLVAIRQTNWGAFFFYPATSIGLFVFSVPYLLLSSKPDIQGTLTFTLYGAVVCMAASVICVLKFWAVFPDGKNPVSVTPIFQLGFMIGVSRVLQTAIYWIPVWAIGVKGDAAAIGSMGTASRLAAAVAAVMAAIRFTIRPEVVRHATQGNWNALAVRSRQLASIATLATLVALGGTLLVGRWAIGLVFGSTYSAAAPIVAVFLIGTLGECIGGPVDEIMKMTGNARRVMTAVMIGVGAEAALVWAMISRGSTSIAAMQSLVFVCVYAYMLWFVRKEQGVYVGATFRLRDLKVASPGTPEGLNAAVVQGQVGGTQ
jgi:O-antigen/teichoic acid export membrane protein